MNREPDISLTLLLMAPYLIVGAVAAYMYWSEMKPKRRRLTQDEVQRLCRIPSERARQGRWN